MGTRSGAQAGFTLIEMIVVIVITGIIAGMVAMFIRAPVQGYVDSERRAEMTDIADMALRRLARDLRTAVPNSIRVPNPSGSSYIEFLPTRDGGRYRVTAAGGGSACAAVAGDVDDGAFAFGSKDTCFEIIGTAMDFAQGDAIVIGSTQSSGNFPYLAVGNAASVRRMVPAAGAGNGRTTVRLDTAAAANFPTTAEQDGHRFEVVPVAEQAVTYACLNPGVDGSGDGTGTLTRYWAYGFNAAQAAPPLGGSNALLADKVHECSFVYDTSNARNSLVAVRLKITRGGESVNLYQEIHINNIP
ncbi:MAG: prepilin-type N-terminal cleavage/methylation domain-containing protein [Nitrosomonadales bacterium]|nr:prepilin-type N-terminal cleavage/methylation domain-containing protein [Nitrosomonadales bacterium]